MLSQRDKREGNDTLPALSSREFLWFVFLFCFEDSLKRQKIALAHLWISRLYLFLDLLGYLPCYASLLLTGCLFVCLLPKHHMLV